MSLPQIPRADDIQYDVSLSEIFKSDANTESEIELDDETTNSYISNDFICHLFSTSVEKAIEYAYVCGARSMETKHETLVLSIIESAIMGYIQDEFRYASFTHISENIDNAYVENVFLKILSNQTYIQTTEILSSIGKWTTPLKNKYKLIKVMQKCSFVPHNNKMILSGIKDSILFSLIHNIEFSFKDNEFYELFDIYVKNPTNLMNIAVQLMNSHKPQLISQTITKPDLMLCNVMYKICLRLFSLCDKSRIFTNTVNYDRKNYQFEGTDTNETKIYITTLNYCTVMSDFIAKVSSINNMFNDNPIFQLLGLIDQMPNIYSSAVQDVQGDLIVTQVYRVLFKNYISTNKIVCVDTLDMFISYYIKYITNNTPTQDEIDYFVGMIASSDEVCNKHFKFDILYHILMDDKIKTSGEIIDAFISFMNDHDILKIITPQKAIVYNEKILTYLLKSFATVHATPVYAHITDDVNDNVIKPQNTKIIKFLYKLNTYATADMDNITEVSKQIASLSNEQQSINKKILVCIMSCIEKSLKITNFILTTKIVDSTTLKGESILPVISMAMSIIKYFTDGKNIVYNNVFCLSIESLRIMREAVYLLYTVSQNGEFGSLVSDSKDSIINALPYISLDTEKKYITNLLIEYLKSIKIDTNVEVPDEFLDPILYIPIETPVMIPNVDEIFDRTSIASQIHSSGLNPYTREKLTESILNEYNGTEKIRERLSEFTKKFKEWKNKNTK